MANTEDLHEFLALASSPIRSPARDAAHRAWEDYKIRRQVSAYQSRNAALLTKGSYIQALQHRALDLTGVDIAAQVTGWAQGTGGRLILGFADLRGVVFDDATLGPAWLKGARLSDASLRRCDLKGARLMMSDLCRVDAQECDLEGADLSSCTLTDADLTGANLRGANLENTVLVRTNLRGADLTGCRVYGMAAWDVELDGARQTDLVITQQGAPEVTVDRLEISQFIHLLLSNEKIRDVIDTIGKRGVLLLGRFTGGRMAVLERLRAALRQRGFVPMVFNFDRPDTRDLTETVRILTGLSRFVIADITNPRSTPLELQSAIPEFMIPFVPIIERGEEPFAMFQDLWIKHRDWVLDPIRYSSIDRLIEVLDREVIGPAEARFASILERKAEQVRIRDV